MHDPIEVLISGLSTQKLDEALHLLSKLVAKGVCFRRLVDYQGVEQPIEQNKWPDNLGQYEWGEIILQGFEADKQKQDAFGRFYKAHPEYYDLEITTAYQTSMDGELGDYLDALYDLARVIREHTGAKVFCGLEPATDPATQFFVNETWGTLRSEL